MKSAGRRHKNKGKVDGDEFGETENDNICLKSKSATFVNKQNIKK